MSTRDLRSLSRDPSYVPARADFAPLFELLRSDDDAEAVERALARAGLAAAEAAIARFEAATAPVRGRLCRLIGRVAGLRGGESLVEFLLARLGDADAKTRRNAIAALGKLNVEGDVRARIERALLARWPSEPKVEHRRTLAAALGKIGGQASIAALGAAADDGDPELRRIVSEAMVKLERTVEREARGAIDEGAAPANPVPIRFHAKRGLEGVLAEELSETLVPEVRAVRVVGPGVVEAVSTAKLGALYRARTFVRFGFPLPVPEGSAIEERIAAAIASDETFALLSRLTRGPITWRLEWASAGHRRAATYRCAAQVQAARPELRNDPRASLWELVVVERGRRGNVQVSLEAWPKGLEDPRFSYRVADVPAASHPTVAAALARVAGVRRDEVVWDPFVGAGTELVERARIAPVHALYGNDTDAHAIEAARRNLAAAGFPAILVVGDARSSRPPERVSLVITNPPMGKRVLERRALEPLFDGLLANVAAVLRRDGRVVMLSPLFGRSIELAHKHGLSSTRLGTVDLGGVEAELQVFQRARR